MSNKKGEEETKGRALCKQTRNTRVSRHFLNGTPETGDGLKNYTWEQDRNYKEPSWEITSYHLLWNSYLLEYFYLKKWWTRPDTVVQTCSPSTRGWGRRTAWAQEFKVTLGNTVFKKKKKKMMMLDDPFSLGWEVLQLWKKEEFSPWSHFITHSDISLRENSYKAI